MRLASRIYPVVILFALASLLTACGADSSTGTASAAATATPTATTIPTATPLPTVDTASLPSTCKDIPYGSAQSLVHIGDLVVSQLAFGLAYPSYELPDGIPLKPFKLPSVNGNPFPGTPPVNPNMRETPGGYVLSVCNDSTSQSHILESFSVRLAAFTAYNGQLNAWGPCAAAYNTQTQTAGGGCGGGAALNEALHATFPADASAGTTVVAVQTGSWDLNNPNKPFPPLPLKLAPGQSVSINIGLTVPTAPGIYTFSFGVSADAAAPVFFSTPPAALYALVAHAWDGQACTTPAMKAQIPDSATPTYYICPKA